ncbi:MAG: PEP-CTERM sorting domain-containing protein [Candidatus Ancaeobacter aquaticus]|nr:PEP-CTERM sorting domain-containing protein [Candidatus Ancaeobacter aquaticus]
MKKLFVLIIAIFFTSISLTAYSDTHTWDGGGADNNWATAANWASNVAPSNYDALTFAGTTRLTPYNNTLFNNIYGPITFTSTGFDVSSRVEGINVISGITNNAGLTNTISATNVYLENSQSFTNNGTSLTFSGTVYAINEAYALTVDGLGATSMNKIIGASGGSLVKSGNGTLTVTGNCYYTGTTSIDVGTLIIDNDNSESASTINNTGTLGGGGTVGTVTIDTGGTISPGTGDLATLTSAGQRWNNGGNYAWGVNDSDCDLLSIGGALNLGFLTTNFTIEITGDPVSFQTWTIANFTSLTGDFDAGEFTLDNQTGVAGDWSLAYNAGNTSLDLTCVPEPSTYALFGIGIFGLIIGWMRKNAISRKP